VGPLSESAASEVALQPIEEQRPLTTPSDVQDATKELKWLEDRLVAACELKCSSKVDTASGEESEVMVVGRELERLSVRSKLAALSEFHP
jgi:hypothetical protein